MRSLMRFLSLYMAFCQVAFAANSDVEIDLLRYNLSSGSASVLGRASGSTETAIFIPDRVRHEGRNYTVTKVAQSAFGNNGLTSVRLPPTLLTIDTSAFVSNKLTSVDIGDNVSLIGLGAFMGNELETVNLGNSVTEIPLASFAFNSIRHITIPASVSRLDPYAFEDNLLKSVTFEGNVGTFFSRDAFADNHSLTSIEACDQASGWENARFNVGYDEAVFVNVELTPYACADALLPTLPVWMMWAATNTSSGNSVCEPPGTAITDDNFSDAIDDWLSLGNRSAYGDITRWCTSNVTDMSNAFNGLDSAAKANFNADISGWDTSWVTNMNNMFRSNAAFNQDIGNWDTSRVTTMRFMFERASAFNAQIGSWNVSAVTDMSNMFSYTETFDQNIGSWKTGSVTDMSNMFLGAERFNQNISNWDVGSVVFMFQMFRDAKKFTGDLSNWEALELSDCFRFATGATDWLNIYGGSITNKTPPLSASMIAAGCDSD